MYRLRGAIGGQIVLFYLLLLALTSPANAGQDKRCLYVSSYHKGYAWSDGVERGLRSVLQGKCEIKQLDMDTKRNRSIAFKQQAALEAKSVIEQWQPDIVITADDNAARFLLQAHYRDSEIPFVFSGINWSAREYGLPYKNTTGIIEVAPIRPLLKQVKNLLGTARKAVYIGADTPTEQKNYRRFAKMAKQESIELQPSLVSTTDDWLQAYRSAQQQDFVVIGSNAGIRDWNKDKVVEQIKRSTRKLSVTNHDWMMPYTILGFTKVPEEQGEMAGRAALSILNGVPVSSIAIVPNRKWDLWTNTILLDILESRSGIKLPELLLRKSKQIH